MILYYAMGGGMGHLVRASAFLHTFDLKPYKILTASANATRIFDRKDLITVDPEMQDSPENFLGFIQENLLKHNIERIILDCFASGILGEICHPGDVFNIPLDYVSRRIRWDRYKEKVSGNLKFGKSFILEEPEPEHLTFIHDKSDEVWEGSLKYPEYGMPEKILQAWESRSAWLIVHSGPEEEVRILINHALDIAEAENIRPELLLISPIQIPGITSLDFYPASSLFPLAGRIFSGCGFNIMQQTSEYRDKHIFIPFERKYDDQFRRADQAKKKQD